MHTLIRIIEKLNIRAHEFRILIVALALVLIILLLYYFIRRQQRRRYRAKKTLYTQRSDITDALIKRIEKEAEPIQRMEAAISRLEESLLQITTETRDAQQGQTDAIDGHIRSALLINRENSEAFQEKMTRLESQLKLLNTSLQDSNQLDGIHKELTELRAYLGKEFRVINSNRETQEVTVLGQHFNKTGSLVSDKQIVDSAFSFSECMNRMTEYINSIEQLTTSKATCEDSLIRLLQSSRTSNLPIILHQLLTPCEYKAHLQIGEDGSFADYAIIIPEPDKELQSRLLPVDCSFTAIDGSCHQEALATNVIEELDVNENSFFTELKKHAYQVTNRLIKPPITTDFALLYFDNEEAFSRVLKKTELIEKLYQENHVIIVNSVMLTAIIQTLRNRYDLISIEKSVESIKSELSMVSAALTAKATSESPSA